MELINRIDEWMYDIDISRLRDHIKKYGDLLAIEAEQMFNLLELTLKKAEDCKVTGFEFMRDAKTAEIMVYMTGNYYTNDAALKKVLQKVNVPATSSTPKAPGVWQVLGGSYRLTKPNIPAVWHIRKVFDK